MLMQHSGLAVIINTTGDTTKSWVTGMIPKLVPQMSFTTSPWSISGQVAQISPTPVASETAMSKCWANLKC